MQIMHSLKILAISCEETLKLDCNIDKHVLYLGFKEFDRITSKLLLMDNILHLGSRL